MLRPWRSKRELARLRDDHDACKRPRCGAASIEVVGCPGENAILSFALGELTPSATREIELHIDECIACAELVADAARSMSGPMRSAEDPSDPQELDTRLSLHRTDHLAPPPEATFVPGQSVGRYRILDRLGAGGMGIVYRAYDPELERFVALKLLRGAQGSEGSGGDARLLREAQLTAQLAHPNVVSVFEVGTQQGHVYLAMELVEGSDLRQWLQQTRPLAAILEVFAQAAKGLAAAHHLGMIHRDFKPDNVLVGEGGRVRVMDFGLARLLGASEHDTQTMDPAASASASASFMSAPLTATGTVMGTPAYMAPEQHAGTGIDERSDQYAFFVALYEALYGRRPFTGRVVVDIALQKHAGPPETPARGEHRVPRWLRRVLQIGLEPDPAHRFESMDSVARQLEQGPRRTVRALGFATLALGVGLAGVAWATTSTSDERSSCATFRSSTDAFWGPSQREAVKTALLSTGLSYAEQTWTRVEDGLDRHAAAWGESRVQACEAAARGDHDEATASARRRCLDTRRAELAALVRVLAEADASVMPQAVRAVSELRTASDCTTISTDDDPPDDAATHLEARLHEASALGRAGRYEAALEAARAVEQEARASGHASLLQRSLVEIGAHASRIGAVDDATKALEEAFFGARERGDAALAFRAASSLAGITGFMRAQIDDARQWLRHAEAELGGYDAPPRARASLLKVRASVSMRAGEYEASMREIQQAIEMLRSDRPDGDFVLSDYLNNLGNALYMLGRYEEAIEQHRRALTLREHHLGDAHPFVGDSHGNLGAASFNLGRYDDAIEHHGKALEIARASTGERSHDAAIVHNNLGGVLHAVHRHEQAIEQYQAALAIWAELFGPDDAHVALAENNLGNVYQSQGRCDLALRHYGRALDLRVQTHGREHPDVAATLNNEAICLKQVGRLDEARERFEQALQIQERTLGPTHPDLGHALDNLAVILREQGRTAEAVTGHRRALELRHAALGDDHLDVGKSRYGLGRALLEQGDATAAIDEFERAVQIYERSGATSLDLAAARFALARASWSAGQRDERATSLARVALQTYQAESRSDRAQEVSRWLDERR